MIAFITWDVKPQILTLGSFELRWYSLLFGLGFILGYYIIQRMFKKEGIPVELLDKLTFYVIIATIIGARFGHCIFYEPETYLKNPLKIILPFEGKIGEDFRYTGFQGLASHGGALGLFIGLYLFSRKFKRSYIWILDRIAIVTALAATFIRTGNLFNSEVYGVQTDLPWGFKFMLEKEYKGPTHEVLPKHPTQIYEALAYLMIFIFLILFYNKKNEKLKPGFYIGWFLILVFTARFFIEFIKEDQVGFEDGMALNMGQILSIPMVAVGIIFLLMKTKKTEKI